MGWFRIFVEAEFNLAVFPSRQILSAQEGSKDLCPASRQP